VGKGSGVEDWRGKGPTDTSSTLSPRDNLTHTEIVIR